MNLSNLSAQQILVGAIILTIWELSWKGFALWKAARNNHRNWFIFLLIVNTIGIIPILYLSFFSKKKS